MVNLILAFSEYGFSVGKGKFMRMARSFAEKFNITYGLKKKIRWISGEDWLKGKFI